METSLWVKVKGRKFYRGWEAGAIKSSKNKPPTGKDEVAVKITLDLPDSLFERPQIEARIEIPKDSVTPPKVDAEVQDNIAEVLTSQLGMKVHVGYDQPGGTQ